MERLNVSVPPLTLAVAFNEVTNHKVAIKILNKKHIKQQGVFEKVKREIKVLRRFNHPHIIKHFEFVDTSSDIFIVLEYAAGGELFDLISKKERVRNNLSLVSYSLMKMRRDEFFSKSSQRLSTHTITARRTVT